VKTVTPCPWADDGVPDHRGDTRCPTCGRPAGHPAHNPPQTDPEVRAYEARKTGDADE
jgi:hypothetical protein